MPASALANTRSPSTVSTTRPPTVIGFGSWWTASPNANIGIAAGSKSGIIVLDIDPRNGGYKSLKRLKEELGPLPDTVTARTGGGGRHLVFKYPSFAVRKDTSGKKFGKGVDILSDGCIMVAPPSRHVTGKRYRWKEGKSYRDLEPATLPKTWLDRLRRSGSAESGKDNPSAQTDGRILEGQRNTSPHKLGWNLATRRRVACGDYRGPYRGKQGQVLAAARPNLRSRKSWRALPSIRRPHQLAMALTTPNV